MRPFIGWGLAGIAGVSLAVVVGIVGWTVTSPGFTAVSMASTRPARAPRVAGSEAVSAHLPRPLPRVRVSDLMERSMLNDRHLDRVDWLGGGLVSCNISEVITDPRTTLTLATEEPFVPGAHVDMTSFNTGQRWPFVYLVTPSFAGTAQVLARAPHRSAVLDLAWTGASPDGPVACRVTAVRDAQVVRVGVRAAEWPTHPQMVAVVGCGQSHVVTEDNPVAEVLVAEGCAVTVWRSVGLATSYSAPRWVEPSDLQPVVDMPDFPVAPDLDSAEVLLDLLVERGARHTHAVFESALDQLTRPDAARDAAVHVARAMDDLRDAWEADTAAARTNGR